MDYFIIASVFFIFVLFWFMYCFNIYRLVKSDWSESKIITTLRVVGVFIPLLGALMSVVPS